LKEARKILEAGNIKTVECTIRKPDNTCFPAEISTSVLVDAHGAPMAFIDVVRDITKRKQLENELQTYHTYLEELANKRTTKLKTANEQLQLELDEYKKNEKELRQAYSELQAMFRAFPDMYFRLASDGTILDYTTEPGISSRFPESLLKKRIQDIFPHDVGHQFELAMPRALRKNERIRIEYEVPVPDNDEYYEEARILPVLDDQILVIIREITEHKKMEKLLRECEENLRTLSSQRNEEDIEVQGN
jgi:PAS domain-containing protein